MLRFLFHPFGEVFAAIIGNIAAFYMGYALCNIKWLRRETKELQKLHELYDQAFAELMRRVDFQLRAKGCEGISKPEIAKEGTVTSKAK